MPGLDDLAKSDVENVFSYTLNKFDNTKQFLGAFETTLKNLFEMKDYDGGWNSDGINAAVTAYTEKTDAIKEDYRAKKIVHITGSSMSVLGGILSFTPFAPVGWGLLAVGTATNSVTDVVDLADKSKQHAWEKSKNNLRDFVNNPFEGTTFKIVYDGLMKTFADVKDKVAIDDYSILLQGLGWNYFAFRKEGMNHQQAISELTKTLELFRTHRYTLSTDLKTGKQEAIQDIQNVITPSCNSLLSSAGALVMIGLAAGVSITAITAGINIAASTFRYAETIARGLLSIGNFATKALNVIMKAGPAVAIIGGVISIVFDSISLSKIDETFQPYYDYRDQSVELIRQYEKDYMENNEIIRSMIDFMNEDEQKKEAAA